MKHLLLLISVFSLFSCSVKKTDYTAIAAMQDMGVPDLQMKVTDTTRVLVVVPHADDETIAGGLIAWLSKKGASVHLLTLCGHSDLRMNELRCSAGKLGISNVETAGLVNNSWDDIMAGKVAFWYDYKDSIRQVILNKINTYRPDILITYDVEIGGYGHPEHLVSAQLTEQIFRENSSDTGFRPSYLLQITLPDKLEQLLVSGSPGYELTKKQTGSTGLPAPDVALDIRDFMDVKNEAAQCHQSQINTLRKFYIAFEPENREAHIKAFGWEYYRLIKR